MRLADLLDEAKERCAETIAERRGSDITAAELEESSSVMGYGAVKYADLKNNRSTNYKCVTSLFVSYKFEGTSYTVKVVECWLCGRSVTHAGSAAECSAFLSGSICV